MVNCSACAAGVISATLCCAGGSPPAGAAKASEFAEISTGAEAVTVSVNDLVTVALTLSVTRMTNGNVPAACGAPLSAPVDGLSVRPVGKLPESTGQVK